MLSDLQYQRSWPQIEFALDHAGETQQKEKKTILNENNLREMSEYVDWVGISVDSADEKIEKQLGRGHGSHVEHTRRMCRLVHENGMGLKINTTVTRLNYSEDMRPFISSLAPARWKIFQMLSMKDQNSDASDLLLTCDEFEMFRDINKGLVLSNGAAPTFESTDDMLESYLIIGSEGNILLSRGNQRSTIPLEELDHLESRQQQSNQLLLPRRQTCSQADSRKH